MLSWIQQFYQSHNEPRPCTIPLHWAPIPLPPSQAAPLDEEEEEEEASLCYLPNNLKIAVLSSAALSSHASLPFLPPQVKRKEAMLKTWRGVFKPCSVVLMCFLRKDFARGGCFMNWIFFSALKWYWTFQSLLALWQGYVSFLFNQLTTWILISALGEIFYQLWKTCSRLCRISKFQGRKPNILVKG